MGYIVHGATVIPACVFIIYHYTICYMFPSHQQRSGGGSHLEIVVANVVSHGTITFDQSMEQKSDGRDTSLLAGSNGEITNS